MHKRDMIRPWCVACGRQATNKHHEPPKGIGGIGKKGQEPPVLSLCGSGVTGCHGMRHRGTMQFRYRRGRWEFRIRVGGIWYHWVPTIEEMDGWY